MTAAKARETRTAFATGFAARSRQILIEGAAMTIAREVSPVRSPKLDDIHAFVTLCAALQTEQGVLPIGAQGVVHQRTPDGSFYLVEFVDPFFCVVEVPGEALHRA